MPDLNPIQGEQAQNSQPLAPKVPSFFQPTDTDVMVMVYLNALLCCILTSVLTYFLRQKYCPKRQIQSSN